MMAPVYNYAMFGGDLDYWDDIVGFLNDCDVKTDAYLEGETAKENWQSRETVKELMQDPENEDIKNDVLKFLEEAQNEMVCIMMDTGSWDSMGHCDTFREERGLEEGDSDDCWVDFYNSMPTDDPVYNSIVDTSACECSSDCVNCVYSGKGKPGGLRGPALYGLIVGVIVVIVASYGVYHR